jgi:hypothetical protein
MYGPVQDVRIPYQQKRMFGFVTFVYAETVKIILAKGNPHFVCDARVLVKPYKEKGKVPDRFRSVACFSSHPASTTLMHCTLLVLTVSVRSNGSVIFLVALFSHFFCLVAQEAAAPAPRRLRRLHVAHRIAGFQRPLRPAAAADW